MIPVELCYKTSTKAIVIYQVQETGGCGLCVSTKAAKQEIILLSRKPANSQKNIDLEIVEEHEIIATKQAKEIDQPEKRTGRSKLRSGQIS